MKRFRKAFTLIELLVVIAIIAILATVVIINVAGARGKAVNAKVLDDIVSVDKSMIMCNIDGGYLFDNSYGGGVPWSSGTFINPLSGDIICARNTTDSTDSVADPSGHGLDIAHAEVAGKWPAIETYGNSSNGHPWLAYTYGGAIGITSSSTLTFRFSVITGNVSFAHYGIDNVDYELYCTQVGCNKYLWNYSSRRSTVGTW